jgi:hypothetical protein
VYDDALIARRLRENSNRDPHLEEVLEHYFEKIPHYVDVQQAQSAPVSVKSTLSTNKGDDDDESSSDQHNSMNFRNNRAMMC